MAVSGCAHCPARPERLGRSCNIGCKPEGAKRTRGPPCAASAKLGIRRILLPAGAKALFFCPLSGSGAVAESSPICTNRLFETGQVRRERSGNVHRLAQLDETKPVSTGRTKRPMKRRFSFVPGAARFLLPRQKKMWGAFLAPNRCLSHAGNGADAFQKGTHSPRRKRRDLLAPTARRAHPATSIDRT